MNYHHQNLNEKPGGRIGSILRHGRAWLSIGRGGVNWEWVAGGIRCHASAGFVQSEECGLSGSLAIPLLGALYVTIHGGPFAWLAKRILPKWTFEDGEDRNLFDIRIHDWAIWWEFWRGPMAGWSRKIPRWRCGNFHPLDFFLGKQKYARREVLAFDAVVPMPERGYPCRVLLHEDTWKRPRWPFARRLMRADVEMGDNPIPHPGKGESSWDCGQDATHSLSTRAATVEEAIAAMVETVLRSRRRYGGSVNWRPSEKAA